MRIEIVDVFAETPLAGNQLAVVRDARHLSTAQMQDIAREMNFSETTFVVEEEPGRARVRIFTPEWELPFAGHPTLGTAWVLAEGKGTYTLALDVGDVVVQFEQGMAWMVPPPVTLGDAWPAADAAALVGLAEEELHSDYPLRFAEVGPKFVLIPVRDLAVLKRARLNADLHVSLMERDVPVQCVFLFTDEPYSHQAHFASRMFFNSGGPREDAATGSANSAFAAYLRALGKRGDYVVDQGVEIKRPSRLYLEVGDDLRVGGRVQPVLRGEIL